MKAPIVTHGWFTDRSKIQSDRSYWIAATAPKGGRRRHYLGRYQGRGTWQWRELHEGAQEGEPPEGTQYLAFREVGAEPFAAYQGKEGR